MKSNLMLIFVSYHTSSGEVDDLIHCLDMLESHINFSIVVNNYVEGEPIDRLKKYSSYFLTHNYNLGYGAAVNSLCRIIETDYTYLGILNTDIKWKSGTFETMVDWLDENLDVSLVTPQILNPDGEVQYLCKQDPTILGMLSRRFIPNRIKPKYLLKYDRWYTMRNKDYSRPFEASYLSGCCMIIRNSSFQQISGFDENFFLYLEDADITRRISKIGRCMHLPIVSIIHSWGKGNYKSIGLMLVNLKSAYTYFRKWGISIT